MGSLHISREETSSMSTKLLEGERALVTGCAGGIGRGIARALLAEGAAVLGSDITVRTGFFLAREVGRHMRDNKIKGRILLITSQHREMPRNLPHYSASKAGMTMVMKELARTLAPDGIRVNAIAPGAIPGGGFVAHNLGALVAQIPIGRPGTPDDIAQVAVAVLSERFGRYVVGTTVEVDGGIGLISWIPAKA